MSRFGSLIRCRCSRSRFVSQGAATHRPARGRLAGGLGRVRVSPRRTPGRRETWTSASRRSAECPRHRPRLGERWSMRPANSRARCARGTLGRRAGPRPASWAWNRADPERRRPSVRVARRALVPRAVRAARTAFSGRVGAALSGLLDSTNAISATFLECAIAGCFPGGVVRTGRRAGGRPREQRERGPAPGAGRFCRGGSQFRHGYRHRIPVRAVVRTRR